eukprot:Tbor_TRINITY_DN5458_c0_g3::TRINITY_DN5458_c0_g3_i1::g.24592::m.24592
MICRNSTRCISKYFPLRPRPLPSPTNLGLYFRTRQISVAFGGLFKQSTALYQKASDVSYKCSSCGKTFRLQNALNHHIMTKHGGQAEAISLGKDGKPVSSVTEDEKSKVDKPTPVVTPTPSVASSSPISVPKPSPISSTPTEDAIEKKLFVCTICQKTFRLEAALHHHYQAKHNMEPPVSASGPKSSEASNTSNVSPTQGNFSVHGASSFSSFASSASAAKGNEDSTVSGTSYIHSGESIPQAWEYHLDAAPNAPEEGEIAAHWRCVNHGVFVGEVQDVQDGYVFEDPVIQFTVVTQFENPFPGDPDKDHLTVRVFGDQMKHVKSLLDGMVISKPSSQSVSSAASNIGTSSIRNRVMVSGRVRLIPQYEPSTNKFYHFPILMVQDGCGSVNEV